MLRLCLEYAAFYGLVEKPIKIVFIHFQNLISQCFLEKKQQQCNRSQLSFSFKVCILISLGQIFKIVQMSDIIFKQNEKLHRLLCIISLGIAGTPLSSTISMY